MAKCIIVLGMHRSATSLIAKGLVAAGVNMGSTYLKRDSGNPKGYYEDMDFFNLNKKILKIAGGDWQNIPSEEQIMAVKKNPDIIKKIKNLINRKQKNKELWGWKDPRTILTIKLYEPFIKDPIYVVCYRDPKDIAKSLNVRHGLSIKKGISLSNEYNYRLKKFIDERSML